MSGTTGMPAAPSATGFSRRAGSRRMGRTSPRESDAHNRPHGPSSSQVRTQETFGASRYTARDKRLVVVSELQAGWYRYVSQWRFHDDGTIRPRFGFSAVRNACVCNVHHHHVYWRFDFDIGTAENNAVREFNSPALFPLTTGTPTASRRRAAEDRTSAAGGRSRTRRPKTHTTLSQA